MTRLASIIVLLLCVCHTLMAVPVARYDVPALVQQADLVVVGEVTSTSRVGDRSVRVGEKIVSAAVMSGRLTVDLVLKGTEPASAVNVVFLTPVERIGYADVPLTRSRIMFLKHIANGYEFVSPYYPSVVAVNGRSVIGRTDLEKVTNAIGEVLKAPTASSQERTQAIDALRTIETSTSAAILQLGLSDHDPKVRFMASAALLKVGDDGTALRIAVAGLLSQSSRPSQDVIDNLRAGISEGLRSERSIPIVHTLLQSQIPEDRRVVAYALWHLGSPSAIPETVELLQDQDMEVRYIAVCALADITGEKSHRTTLEAFRTEGAGFVTYWTTWARQRGIIR